MPELPEVETVRKGLLKRLKDKKIINIKILYPKIFENQNLEEIKEKIINQKIINIDRRGKWLIFELNDYYLLSHLRMEGKYLYRNSDDEYQKHELVAFTFEDMELRYQDTRKFGKMYLLDKQHLFSDSPLSKLGLEPWDESLNEEYLLNKLKNKKLPIKTILLDQTIITGIGNIYADEILFLSKINPYKKGNMITKEELKKIILNTKIILEKAIDLGGTTIRSYTSEEGISGRFQNNLLVHSRENEECLICKTKIIREKIGGRSTYFCPKCQK